MHRRLSAILIAAGVAVAIAGCGSSGSSGSGTARTLGDQACGAVFKMRNGGVNNLGEAVVQAATADDAAQLARGLDPAFAALSDDAQVIRAMLTLSDGRTPVQPSAVPVAYLQGEIEAAARECVSLEAAGKVS